MRWPRGLWINGPGWPLKYTANSRRCALILVHNVNQWCSELDPRELSRFVNGHSVCWLFGVSDVTGWNPAFSREYNLSPFDSKSLPCARALSKSNKPHEAWLAHSLTHDTGILTYTYDKISHRVVYETLTHLPLIPHICVSESGHHWFK